MKYIDEMIQEAQKRGDFNNLKGEGKPLDLTENPFNKETRLAHNLVKQAGFTLGFIAERQAIEGLIAKARHDLRHGARKSQRGPFAALRWRKTVEGFRAAGADLNRRIRNYNLKAPREQFHLLPIEIESELTLARQEYPQPSSSG